MALPLVYNLESVRARWTSTLVAVLGIAGSVGVFVAMFALARGFQAAVVTSGSPHNVMVRRAGATSEMDSAVTLEQLRVIEDSGEITRSEGTAVVSPEVVVTASLPLKATGTDAMVQVRGVLPRAPEVHDRVQMTRGRFFTPGLAEVVVGKNAANAYRDLAVGDTLKFGGRPWAVVGTFDAGGSSF
ncbi:MAG TPA: ABC transporter permease, partial [Vicinamibacteria bacterium]